MPNVVYIVSDSTGDTAEKVLTAALKQFDTSDVRVEIFSRIRTSEAIEDVIESAADRDAMVVHTIVNDSQRTLLQSLCAEAGIDDLDLIGPLVGKLASQLAIESKPSRWFVCSQR